MLFSPQPGVNSIWFVWYHSVGSLYQELLLYCLSSWCAPGATTVGILLSEFHRETVSHWQSNLRLMKESSASCPNGRTESCERKQNHSSCRALTKQAIGGSQEEEMEKRKVCDLAEHRELWASTDLSRQSRWCEGAGQCCTEITSLALEAISHFFMWHPTWATCTGQGLS